MEATVPQKTPVDQDTAQSIEQKETHTCLPPTKKRKRAMSKHIKEVTETETKERVKRYYQDPTVKERRKENAKFHREWKKTLGILMKNGVLCITAPFSEKPIPIPTDPKEFMNLMASIVTQLPQDKNGQPQLDTPTTTTVNGS